LYYFKAINWYKPQGRALDPLSGASPGELTIVPIPRPLPCWQGRGAGEGYVKLMTGVPYRVSNQEI